MFEAQYLGKHATNGTHAVSIGEDLYSFKFNSKEQAISFSKGGKIVARTYRTFKRYLGIADGSVAAGKLIAATQSAPIYHPEYFKKYGY